MGNLLGAPVTEKETHVGVTDQGIEYGVSSMQGWRVHMEDAHIAEEQLYAAQVVKKDNNSYYNCIELPGHSLFAVFDGHGGKFAAIYSGRNLCRVLSRQKKFCEYAQFELERPTKTATLDASQREAYIQSGLKLLEEALGNAFVELDKEIACALKGRKVADADLDYQQLFTPPPNNATQQQQQNGGNAPPTATEDSTDHVEEEGDSGTTACVVVLTPEWIVCANAGDSRSVMSRLGSTKAVPLSFDHKPDDEAEERRIRTAGGYVAGGRVEGDLAVSRGLGDFRFKNMAVVMAVPFSGIPDNSNRDDEQQQHPLPTMQPGEQKVSPIPDIIAQSRNAPQDEFIIVACDGIWDVQTNYEAVKTVAEMFQEGESNLGLLCEEVCDVGLNMGSKDNMTVLVVKLAAQKIGEGGGVLARRQLRDAEKEDKVKTEEQAGPNP